MAILLVYAVALGALGGFARVVTPRRTAPRVGQELGALRREGPELAEGRAHPVDPRARTGQLQRRRASRPRRLARPRACAATCRPSSLPVRRPDGVDRPSTSGAAFAVVRDEARVTWLLHSSDEEGGAAPLDPNRILSDAVGKTFAYAQDNSIEIARALRGVIVGVSRVLFVFFITLMLAAYLILTRERILVFFGVSGAAPRKQAPG